MIDVPMIALQAAGIIFLLMFLRGAQLLLMEKSEYSREREREALKRIEYVKEKLGLK
jgi:hypothetical protein